MISGAGDFSRRRRNSSPPDLLSFFVYSVVFYLGLCFHPLLLVLIFGGKGPRQIQRQKQRNRALGPDIAIALSIWLLLSTVLSTVPHRRLVAISAVSSLVVVHAPAQLAVTPVSGTLLVTAQLTEASGCVKSVCTFTESIHMASTTSIQNTHAQLSSPQSPVPVTISNRISPTLANCLLGLYADKLSSNIEAATSWHVLNGAELHSLRLSPTPSTARSGPLWPCLLPQPGSESAKGPFFPPRLDLPDPPDCGSSGFSEPPSPFIKDSEPSSDDQHLIYSMMASMEQRTRLGSAKARVFQHGNVGVQSCVLNNVLALPWILVNDIYISWSEVFEKSIVYMGLETTLASVYRVHLAQSRDVMLNLRTLFVELSQVSRVCSNSNFVTCAIRFQGPSSLFISDKSMTGILSVSVEIHLVSSESVVGARAALARSASFQALLVGLFNVDSDYFMLVVVTYLGVHLMISHGSPVVEQVSLVKFVMSCFAVLLVFIKLSRVGIKLPTVEVRFEKFTIEADCHIGKRALPTLPNVALNIAGRGLSLFGFNFAKTTKLTILRDASGIIKPSRMTLLLGPPSSGKTTLLLALAGKLDPSLKVTGRVTYNGYGLGEIVPQKTSAYISQNDVHIGVMTVQETLDFSARCQGIGTRYDLLSELVRREKDAGILPEPEVDLFMKSIAAENVKSSLITDYTLKILGLDICKDTVVGDEMIRGISGGQKKRVTTGEMIVGPTKTLFMDEISTGLDSSTTYQIVKCLKEMVRFTDATVLMSLLQPAPETFELFDDIILLSEGQIVYQGPRDHILSFFETCGFKCPERKGTADFLQEVTSRKDQEQYWADTTKPYRYIPVSGFSKQFRTFHVGAKLENDLSVPYDRFRSHPASLVFNKQSVPKSQLFKICWDRELLLIKRNAFFYVFKTVQIIIMALIASTVYLRTGMGTKDENDGAVYIGALMFSMIANMFNGFAELSLMIQRLPVFYKQRDLLFHPSWTFTLPTFLLSIPISIFESVVWVSITYYLIGFSPEPSRFFKHLLVIFLTQQMAGSIFRFIATTCRSMILANTGGSLVVLLLFLLGGFIVPRGEIPTWWQWAYWVSPMTYTYDALTVNEMLAPRWMDQLSSDNSTRLGLAVLEIFDVFTDPSWYWIGVGAVLGFTILFNILATLALAYLNPLEKPQAIVSKEGAEENIVTNGSKGKNTYVKRGMVLPFTPYTMSFDKVNYYVDMPKDMREQEVATDKLQLLREVTGVFRPGVLTALMGVSGAGKTTLMDVLAGRKTGGYIEGDIRISGFPKRQETFARVSGYCEQNDIHSPQVTVRESLIYSAFLRLPKEVTKDEKMRFVDQVMELVELKSLKDGIVGLPGISGLSTEQRKRLTIAVELVANPSIIFMDEPTSGLDARAAAIVMRTVRNTVDTGRTVVCTIHQPSIDIFEAFDELLLMKRGGQVIYAGPLGQNSHKIVEYFQAIPGVPKIKEKYNPATWMLEVSSVAAEAKLDIDFAEHYVTSSLYQQNKKLVKEVSTPPRGAKDLYFSTQFSESFLGQFKSCLWKQWITYWRTPDYNLARFFFTFFAALMVGSIFWKVGTTRDSANDLTKVIGAMYAAVLFVGINNATSVQPLVAVERTVFYRERAAEMYSALPYALAQVVCEIPFVLIQTTYYTLITYAMMCFEWTVVKFFWFFFVSFFSFLYFTYYGMMAVAITPNQQVAAIFAGAFYGLFNLFSGFLIPRPRIPKWWIWYYWICPVAWTVYGLIVSQYGDQEDTIKVPGMMEDPTIKWYIENHYGYDPNFMGSIAAVLVGFTVFFAFMFAFGIKMLNFQQR